MTRFRLTGRSPCLPGGWESIFCPPAPTNSTVPRDRFSYARKGLGLRPLMTGGAQERGDACRYRKCAGNRGDGEGGQISHRAMRQKIQKETALRNYFLGRLLREIPGVTVQRFHADAPPQQCEYLCGWRQWRCAGISAGSGRDLRLRGLCLLGGKRPRVPCAAGDRQTRRRPPGAQCGLRWGLRRRRRRSTSLWIRSGV